MAEIIRQCEYTLRAVGQLNEALRLRKDNEAIFYAAHSFLQHAGLVSKLIWPSSQCTSAKVRGKKLRAALDIDSGNTIQSRKLRNHIEHFDERLDAWVDNSPHQNYIDGIVGRREAIKGPKISKKDFMRHFDDSTNIFTFNSEPYDLQKMTKDIEEILNKAKRQEKLANTYKATESQGRKRS